MTNAQAAIRVYAWTLLLSVVIANVSYLAMRIFGVPSNATMWSIVILAFIAGMTIGHVLTRGARQ